MSRSLAPLAAVIALAQPLASEAAAKPPPSQITVAETPLVGTWRIGRDGEGAMTCAIYLRAPAVIGGHEVKTAKICVDAIDRADDISAWYLNPDGDLVLADPLRKPVYRFHRLEGGIWATEGDDVDRVLLRPASQVGISH